MIHANSTCQCRVKSIIFLIHVISRMAHYQPFPCYIYVTCLYFSSTPNLKCLLNWKCPYYITIMNFKGYLRYCEIISKYYFKLYNFFMQINLLIPIAFGILDMKITHMISKLSSNALLNYMKCQSKVTPSVKKFHFSWSALFFNPTSMMHTGIWKMKTKMQKFLINRCISD